MSAEEGLAELDAQERQLNLKNRSQGNYIRRLEGPGVGPEKKDKVGVVRERSQNLRHTWSFAVLACTVCVGLCKLCVTVSCSYITVCQDHCSCPLGCPSLLSLDRSSLSWHYLRPR